MTPQDLAEIQHELALSDMELAQALELESPGALTWLKSGKADIPRAIATRADWLLDDWRYACLILEKKIRPQFEELVETGEKPARIALVTQLDRDKPEYWIATKPEGRLSLFKQIDRVAKTFFEDKDVAVVSKVEFIKAPAPLPGEETPRELSVLGVRVEAV